MQLHRQKKHHHRQASNTALEQLHDAMGEGDAAAVVNKLQSAYQVNGLKEGVICDESFLRFNEIESESCYQLNGSGKEGGGGEPPKGSLSWAIDNHFGSLDALVQKINAEGAALQHQNKCCELQESS
ncbi:superoxide dismutase [Mn], mitochondrial-like [Syzygium oleosum]|uniref:superoxide dismutase [Mn], mitochondrial-like n=1 Tax=Syzygium oleosum TaxID=219896 RepID=UPI0024BA0737|nr:superoxide dismutase [Mn], mitochondrial-like [Syzygium oleosum]